MVPERLGTVSYNSERLPYILTNWWGFWFHAWIGKKQTDGVFNSMPESAREISKLHVRIWVLGFDHKNDPTVIQRGKSIFTASGVTDDPL